METQACVYNRTYEYYLVTIYKVRYIYIIYVYILYINYIGRQ